MQQCIVHFVALLAILASAMALPTNSANRESDQIEASIEVVKNVAVFQAGSPELRNQLPGESKKVGQQLIYSLGQRVAGDRLVSTKADNKSWPSVQDVTLSLSYPQSGVGAVVTYVQVIVMQTTNLGKGYVVAGGIGQRFIHMVIEAYSTNFFNYSVQIYGI
ncbi:uncharacterized protein LOC135697195 [Ochlerotatus camptorhynchus]|uniref:uncharacterized protein LOC135697195 n=1 Tax=Ochlerotatus camptorhynchus TaxID=644619 RepID=UPI0031D1B3A7